MRREDRTSDPRRDASPISTPALFRVDVSTASWDEVAPVRLRLLRPPGHPWEGPKPGDLLPEARHFVVRDADGAILATATVHPMPSPRGDARAWQLRAVATAPEARHRGAGRAVVTACVEHARAEGASRVWCHARTTARPFYEKLGFGTFGEEYVLPVSGLHVLMELAF